jgi:hypothetical protein
VFCFHEFGMSTLEMAVSSHILGGCVCHMEEVGECRWRRIRRVAEQVPGSEQGMRG